MTTHHGVDFGPRLVTTPTGRLQAALLVKPSPPIEKAEPLPGEPGAIYTRALEQHEVLRKTLEYFGVRTSVVEARGADPYESAVSDVAVLFEEGAALMRLTPLSRRAEVDRTEAEFGRLDIPIAGHIAAPGLLDGNDVLLVGSTAFVGVPSASSGQGARGNELGRHGFAQLAGARGYRVVDVKLAQGVRALRAVAGAAGAETIVVGAEKVDLAAFEGFRTIVLELGEEQAAGVLPLAERHVIADIRFRTALSTMRRAGIGVEALDLYEFTKLGMTPSMLTLALQRE
jgi:dimethylargininase